MLRSTIIHHLFGNNEEPPGLKAADFYDNNEIVDLWTSEFLQGFNNCHPKTASSDSHVAFGLTTHRREDETKADQSQLIRPRTVPAGARQSKHRISLHMPTKLSDSRSQLTNEYLSKITEQQSKVRGTQMLNFKIDLSKAREKRKRQLQYSREIRSGAKDAHNREIDSVTRIVVQSFRKLIDCERCALFLMDEASNELYFKPVGDSDHSHARLKEIRFPATSGVAGWCASNKMMLNIKNAYRDQRFNADIDKKTGFRTRTILCHPVLSSSNQLLGVIQMVNKKKTNPKVLRDKAKKKGYQSCFEHFSTNDEEILGKCCNEVSKSLQEIFSHRKQIEAKSDEQEKVVLVSDEECLTPLKVGCLDKGNSYIAKDEGSYDQSTVTESTYIPEPQTQRRASRRSSVGQLAKFVSLNAADDKKAGHDTNLNHNSVNGKGITEAIQKFKFRQENPEKLHQRELERRLSNPDFLLAQGKREKMTSYVQQIAEGPSPDTSIRSCIR